VSDFERTVNETKYLKGSCQHCAGHIEFPADAAGMTVTCPHCGLKTELSDSSARSPIETDAQRPAAGGWMIATILITLLAGSGGFFYWKKAKAPKPAARPLTNSVAKTPVPSTPKAALLSTNRLTIGAITLEKAKNSSVVYALGQIKNESDDQRFGLKIELDLLDGSGSKIGTATDYLAILEPRKDWHFRALVLETRAVSARFVSIKEDQ
jgi:hypothetical protein